jgi:hypothetical protein
MSLEFIKARQRERAAKDGRPMRAQDFLSGLPEGHSTEPVLTVVPLTIAESEAATRATFEYHKALVANLSDKAKQLLNDLGVVTNAEAVEKVFRACRRCDDLSQPVFASPAEIRDNLTSDELAALYAALATTQRDVSPFKVHTVDDLEALSKSIAGSTSDDLDSLLAKFPRKTLVDVLIYECKAHQVTRDELAALRVSSGAATAASQYGDFVGRVASAGGE